MKTFTKWFINAGIMLGVLALFLYITGQTDLGIVQAILALLVGSLILGGAFYWMEEKYFPRRQKKMLDKVVRIFNAKVISPSQATFKVGEHDFIVDITFNLSLSEYEAQGEVITFYVPQNQLRAAQLKRPLSQVKTQLNGQSTYQVYQTNSWGLKLAKRRIDNRFLKEAQRT